VLPRSLAAKPNLALGLLANGGGLILMVVSGVVVSTVHLYDAGLLSTFPAESMAATWKVYLPDVNAYECGLLHGTKAVLFSLH
jgi:adenine deaminase